MSDIINENNDFEEPLDEKKLLRMLSRIYNLERSNSKTGKFGDTDMQTKIERIIEEEADKCY